MTQVALVSSCHEEPQRNRHRGRVKKVGARVTQNEGNLPRKPWDILGGNVEFRMAEWELVCLGNAAAWQ